LVRGQGFLIDDFTNQAMTFIDAHQDQPFFLYLPLNTPHSPMQVPDRWWDDFKEKNLEMRNRQPQRENLPHVRAALAMCENIDWNVGRLLKHLDKLDLAEDTIVLYFCDNGPNGYRWNGGMKGRKGSTDEGGVRSPLLIRWPGKIAGGKVVTKIGAAIDLLPTLADLADIPVASRNPLDGISLKPLLLGTPERWPDRKIFSHWRGRVSVRTQQFRLDHQGKLYDMTEDPRQDRDITDQQPEIAEDLNRAVAEWKQDVLADYQQQKRPFLIGHPDFEYTQIPARDGIEHGNIKRSNRFPNCSFFTNWTSVEDSITWPVEVLADGEFEVDLYYTCPPSDLGSEIELSFNGNRQTGTIADAHDPPLRGAEHDRVERAESYVKDFRALKLGNIKLEQGTGELTLRALEIPGKQVMDFRLLMFRRIDEP
jgi:hypothetical protein